MTGKSQSILLAGAVSGVITAVLSIFQPWGGCACCITYIGAGMLYVWHHANNQDHGFSMTSGEGAGSGALAGVVAGIVAMILGFVLQQAGMVPGPEQSLIDMREQGQFTDEQMETIEGIVMSPFMYVIGAFITAIVGAVLGAIGGALGASLFAKGEV
ncbi:MAG: hypothetical protein KTR29_22095 [Rhodothermaceae bacterium]|nr:hypothetical protein [Rhodothermaceae bacterium]